MNGWLAKMWGTDSSWHPPALLIRTHVGSVPDSISGAFSYIPAMLKAVVPTKVPISVGIVPRIHVHYEDEGGMR